MLLAEISFDAQTIAAMTAAVGAIGIAIGTFLPKLGEFISGLRRTNSEDQQIRDDRADKGYTYLIEKQALRVSELEQITIRLSNEEAACRVRCVGYEMQIKSLMEDREEHISRILKLEKALGLGSDSKSDQ